MRIVIGTVNEDKIKILKNALKELHLEVEIKGVNVDSEISNQPLNKVVTLFGARNRAKNAFKLRPSSDFAFGIEGGLHDYGDGYHLVTYACLLDKTRKEYIGVGEEIHLPQEVSEKVKQDDWLGDVIREYSQKNQIDENLITRMTPFTEAIHNAYANYLKSQGNLGYRQGTIGAVIDDQKNFLIAQLESYGENDWRFPGGGVNEGETPDQTILRELKEELGTDKFEILKKSKLVNKYEWPDFVIASRLKKEGRTFRGQEQVQFLVKFTGNKEDFDLDPVEIKKIKWVKYEKLVDHFNFPNQWEEAEKMLKSFQKFNL